MSKCPTVAAGEAAYCCLGFHWDSGRISVTPSLCVRPENCSARRSISVSRTSISPTITARLPDRRRPILDGYFIRISRRIVTRSLFPAKPVTPCGMGPMVIGDQGSICSPALIKASRERDWSISIFFTLIVLIPRHPWKRPWGHWITPFAAERLSMLEFPTTPLNKQLRPQKYLEDWAHHA